MTPVSSGLIDPSNGQAQPVWSFFKFHTQQKLWQDCETAQVTCAFAVPTCDIYPFHMDLFNCDQFSYKITHSSN